jgi:hypothetical protein
MISDEDMRRFAEYLVRLCESELSARKALPDGDDRQHRNDDADRNPDSRMRGHKNAAHDQSSRTVKSSTGPRKSPFAMTHGGTPRLSVLP